MAQLFNAREIANRLGGATGSGPPYKVCCPAHDDKNPSLSIGDGDNGRVWYKCHGGCDQADVRRELQSRGLLPEDTKPRKAKANDGATEPDRPAGDLVWPVPVGTPPPSFKNWPGGAPTATYDYRNAEGQLIGVVARWDRNDGNKKIRPFVALRGQDGSLQWEPRGFPTPRPLFGLEKLAARTDAKVLVVEGEKTALAARTIFPDLVVVTWQGGAKAVAQSDWQPLAEREVILWPDNDQPGKDAMAEVEQCLTGSALSIATVDLPNALPAKWDLADTPPTGVEVVSLLAAAKVRRQKLRDFVVTAPDLIGLDVPDRQHLIEPFIVEGGLHMLYAERGLGKTWLALKLALSVAAGTAFFTYEVPGARQVLYVDGEMSLGELKDRIAKLAPSPPTTLRLLPSELLFREARPLNINGEEDQGRIIELIDRLEAEGAKPALIVFDNLSSLSAGGDENDNTALDSLLRWLVFLRHKGIAVLLVHHAGKSGDQRGASRREDLLDTSIRLKRPDDDDGHRPEGAEFIMEFTKTRGKRPVPDAVDVKLVEHQDGTLSLVAKKHVQVKSHLQTLREIAIRRPKTQAELASACDANKGTVSIHCTKLREHGYIDKKLELTDQGKVIVNEIWPNLGMSIAVQDNLPI
jgi:hypothetical protein